jgi:hypothetical protein
MKIIDVSQRTRNWHRARLGIPTASSFDKVMMGKGTQTRQDYMCRLLMERILGRSLDDGIKSKWMAHGIRIEDEARAALKMRLNKEIEPGMFVTTDDGRYGCSPDGFVNQEMLVEIKCPAPWTHCRYHVFGVGDGYKAQVQGQLLVTGYETVVFFSYFPGLPPVCLETGRDDKYIDKLSNELKNFCDELDSKTEWFMKLGDVDLVEALDVLAELMPEDES